MPRQAAPARATTTASLLGFVLARRRSARSPRLRQEDLARAVGVSQSAWSRVELGDNALTVDALFAVAQALGATASAILAEVEDLAQRLPRSGVRVVNARTERRPPCPGLAFAAGVALAGLVVAALMAGAKRG
jgi:DNA-binding XRE family transcriptional regulator